MHKKLIVLSTSIGLLFSGGSGGSWIEDWLYPDTGLFFWAVITFLIVFAVLRWKAWGPLMDTLEAREQQIQDSLNKAEKIIKDQEKSAQDNEIILNEAKEEAKNLMTQAKAAGEKLKLKLEEDGRHKYDELLSNATEAINTQKQKALGEIKNMVAEIALNASEKIIKRNLNDDDNKQIIEETVAKFQEKNQ
jgi:F-type H+-transporting ATPase subunit b